MLTVNEVSPEELAYSKKLNKTPPVSCDLKVGDKITYTNEFGISFENRVVIGFADDDSFYGRFIHLSAGAYWFPARASECKKEVA
jgi:hypothetical protein